MVRRSIVAGGVGFLIRTLVMFTGLASAGLATAQSSVFYIHTDALGSPVAITNDGGMVVERQDYEPYGDLIGKEPTDSPGFTGHVADSLTALSYMQQRYYDPEIGRFLSVDPVTALGNPIGMFSRYRYAANNPYRFVDPDGRCDSSVCKIWGGVARGFGDGVFSSLGNPGPSVYGTVDMSSARTMEAGPVFGVPESQRGKLGYKFGNALAAGQAIRLPARGAAAAVRLPPQTKTVGRWMHPSELRKMRETGYVQEGGGGVTRVADPPSPDTYKAAPRGDKYVEFDVESARVAPHSTGTGRIDGPNSPSARIPGRDPNDYKMPEARDIRER